MKRIIVTGAAGFIGSAFCRHVLSRNLAEIIGIDNMTYAASPQTVDELHKYGKFSLHRMDIADPALQEILIAADADGIVHLAAETHVDRSIDDPSIFVRTNVSGTYNLLECTRRWLAMQGKARQEAFRFLHVSTDEVYGSLGATGIFTETTPYAPNSPYAASKAAADHLVRAWFVTYGLPAIISNCSNNYGTHQFPEKLIPNMIIKALHGEQMPVYGTGDNVRDWLFVDDHAEALWLILTRGKPGEKYNVGGDGEKTNLDLVKQICQLLDKRLPGKDAHEKLITFVADRPGHDKRYAMDSSKLQKELGWKAKTMLPEGLALTVEWYLANRPWWEEIRQRSYAGERLGMIIPPKQAAR